MRLSVVPRTESSVDTSGRPAARQSTRDGIVFSSGLTIFVVATVFTSGLPELRHDWRWPGPDGVPWLVTAWSSAWLPLGLGDVDAYPTPYMFGIALSPFAHIVSPLAVAVTLVAGAVFFCARSADAIASAAGGTRVGRFGVACIATLNPWVYSKLVAGHVFMIAAYAFVLVLVAECSSVRPRPGVLRLLAAGCLVQIQFALVVGPLYVAWLVRRRRFDALIVLACAAVPTIAALVGERAFEAHVPYLLEWQRFNSVPLAAGAQLLGYGFDYAAPFRNDAAALDALVAVALVSALWLRRTFASLACGAGALLVLVFASGTAGPIAALYDTLVLTYRESAVFRELYDLIGLVAVVYIVAVARVTSYRPLAWTGAAIGLSFIAVWSTSPPSHWFVPQRAVSTSVVSAPADERVAFFPAFQPLSLGRDGSGYDPDLYVRTGQATPLNDFLPIFPVAGLLARAEQTRSYDALAWASVSEVHLRSRYVSDSVSLSGQEVAGRPARYHASTDTIVRMTAFPELSYAAGDAPLATIADGLDERAISLADAGRLRSISYEPSEETRDASVAWVDARFAVMDHPEVSSAAGGVFTSSRRPLALNGARAILAIVIEGELRGSGVVVARRASSWQWIRVPRGADVVCYGTCAVAFGADRVPAGPAHIPSPRSAKLAANFIMPWLVLASDTAAPLGTLRFNTTFDGAWTAYAGSLDPLPHFRLDSAVNGFAIGAGTSTRRIVIVQWLAAFVWLAEWLAFAVLVGSLVVPAVRRRRAPGPSRLDGGPSRP